MRSTQSGHTDVSLVSEVADVLAVLADLDEVAAFVTPLLDARSTRDRWLVEPVRLGPVVVRPVTAVEVVREDDVVEVRGAPVDGATPTWLTVRMEVRSTGQDTCVVDTTWEVRVDLPGPQFVARLARPLLAAEARAVTEDLRTRLAARFAG